MSKESAEFAGKILSLDERREANNLATVCGKWGMAWILDVCAAVFDETAHDPERSVLDVSRASDRATLLRAMKDIFQ